MRIVKIAKTPEGKIRVGIYVQAEGLEQFGWTETNSYVVEQLRFSKAMLEDLRVQVFGGTVTQSELEKLFGGN